MFNSLVTPWLYSLPGSSVHRISQARTLEWAAISVSTGIFLTQGFNLHFREDSLTLSHLESLITTASKAIKCEKYFSIHINFLMNFIKVITSWSWKLSHCSLYAQSYWESLSRFWESVSCSVVSDSLQAHQTPLSMGFSRQEYWSGLSFPSPRDLPNPGIEPGSPALQVDYLYSEPPGKPGQCCLSLMILTFSHLIISSIRETKKP